MLKREWVNKTYINHTYIVLLVDCDTSCMCHMPRIITKVFLFNINNTILILKYLFLKVWQVEFNLKQLNLSEKPLLN